MSQTTKPTKPKMTAKPSMPSKPPVPAKPKKPAKAEELLANRVSEVSITINRSKIVGHHPLLGLLPPIDSDGRAVRDLAEDIRAYGVLDALKVVAAKTPGEFLLVDGRNRQAATGLIPLKDVPVIIKKEEDVLAIILSALFHRKHFGKGALAYMAVPLLVKVVEAGRAVREGNLKQGADAGQPGGDAMPGMLLAASLEIECEKLGFGRDMYFQALRVRDIFEANEDYQERMEPLLLAGKVGLGAVIAGAAGRAATKAKAKGDTRYLVLGGNGRLGGLLPKACVTMANGFENWGRLELAAKAAFKREWDSLVAMLPEDLR